MATRDGETARSERYGPLAFLAHPGPGQALSRLLASLIVPPCGAPMGHRHRSQVLQDPDHGFPVPQRPLHRRCTPALAGGARERR